MLLLIVDDDGLIRDSLKLLFETQTEWEVKTAPDGKVALLICRETQPDVVLMDIRMPVCDGVLATKNIKKEFPDIKVIMLTTFTDTEYISSAINVGAEGYLLKSTPADGIIERINAVRKGAIVFDKGVKILANDTEKTESEKALIKSLTPRENEILSLIATGLSNGEISAKLFLSVGTVRNCVSVILEKLSLRDRTQLAVYYWRNIYKV